MKLIFSEDPEALSYDFRHFPTAVGIRIHKGGRKFSFIGRDGESGVKWSLKNTFPEGEEWLRKNRPEYFL